MLPLEEELTEMLCVDLYFHTVLFGTQVWKRMRVLDCQTKRILDYMQMNPGVFYAFTGLSEKDVTLPEPTK